MTFLLADAIQRACVADPPAGWICRKEARLLDADLGGLLGYVPKADLVFEHPGRQERLWVELEISRADPAANHVKFGSAHLLRPVRPADAFVSLVSNDVARGRANLAAHSIHILRELGIRAFQMPLFPHLSGTDIKALNQGRNLSCGTPVPDFGEIYDLTRPVGAAASGVYYATNALEVFLNANRWNEEIRTAKGRKQWGGHRARARYLVYDPHSGRFAPSKFCAYTRIPAAAAMEGRGGGGSLMSIEAYSGIDQDLAIFDGQKAWRSLVALGFSKYHQREIPDRCRNHLDRWLADVSPAITGPKSALTILALNGHS